MFYLSGEIASRQYHPLAPLFLFLSKNSAAVFRLQGLGELVQSQPHETKDLMTEGLQSIGRSLVWMGDDDNPQTNTSYTHLPQTLEEEKNVTAYFKLKYDRYFGIKGCRSNRVLKNAF